MTGDSEAVLRVVDTPQNIARALRPASPEILRQNLKRLQSRECIERPGVPWGVDGRRTVAWFFYSDLRAPIGRVKRLGATRSAPSGTGEERRKALPHASASFAYRTCCLVPTAHLTRMSLRVWTTSSDVEPGTNPRAWSR
jgi:hypothetical protein